MPSLDISTCLQRKSKRYLLAVLVLLQAGCASPGATLQVNPRHDAGIQYAPQEIARMMEILGYEQLRVLDTDTQQSVAVATNDGVYRLLFRHPGNTDILVDVHIITGNGNIGLHLYQPGREDLDADARQQYQRLRQRLVLQYGAEHVSDRHSLFAP